MKLTPEKHFLASHIVKVNYKIPKAEALEIAHYILNVSVCFKIDPWILTGLIQKVKSISEYSKSIMVKMETLKLITLKMSLKIFRKSTQIVRLSLF
jgi:hypothetical protein